ncbi:hypothetical protein ACQKGD_27615 [Peribacillus frigoritolerans]|uniref:hypothetical protein n=1 Tax=Peribacillus frigoritolerans TaxID=450367 RepID=UPI003D0228DD
MTISITDFKEITEFKSKTEFNKSIEMFLAVHKKDFTESEYIAFKRFIRIACNVKENVFGACFASVRYILEQIKQLDTKIGLSESTFHRMKRKAIKLGILETHQRERKNGSQASNLWIFKKYKTTKRAVIVAEKQTTDTPQTGSEQVEPAPCKEKVFQQLTPLDTSNISYTNNLKINIRTENENSNILQNKKLGLNFVNPDIPAKFIKLAATYYDDAEIINEYWKMVKIAEKKAGFEIIEIDLIDVAKDAFKMTIVALKANQINKNVYAFFYGTMQKMLVTLYEDFYKPEEAFFTFKNLINHDLKLSSEEQNQMGLW